MAVFDKKKYKWYEYNHAQPFTLTRRGGDVKLHNGMRYGVRDATSPTAANYGMSRLVVKGYPISHVFTIFPSDVKLLMNRSKRIRQQ